MVDSESHPLKGIRKKVRIVFVVEDVAKVSRQGIADYGKSKYLDGLKLENSIALWLNSHLSNSGTSGLV
jgi:hypothetical protein